jgi:hypothetical protein
LATGAGRVINPLWDAGSRSELIELSVRFLLIATVQGSLALESGPEYFVDNSRFLALGTSVSVVDAASSASVESLDLGGNPP